MDTNRFDGLTRSLRHGVTRRGVLGALAGTAGLRLHAAAAKKGKKKKKKKCGRCPAGRRCCAGRCRKPVWTNLTTFGASGSNLEQFKEPHGIAAAPDGQTVWVADFINERVSVWTKTGPTAWTNPTVFGSAGSEPAQFSQPQGVAIVGDGETVWVADTLNARVSVWLKTGATSWVPAFTFGEGGIDPDQFFFPTHLTLSADAKTTWVADSANNRISIWTETDPGLWENLTTFGDQGTGASQFDSPNAVALSRDRKTIWVADSDNNRVSVWTETEPDTWENLTTFGGFGSDPDQFAIPQSVAIAADERTVWVADRNNRRVSVWTQTGPTTWVNQTTFGSFGSGTTQFDDPEGIAVSADGQTVWVADTGNNRVSVWTLGCPPP